MKTGGKVVVGVLLVGGVAALLAWRQAGHIVKLSGVTAVETYIVPDPEAGGGLKLPKGIVVAVSKLKDEWAFVTVPASISDALFDKNEDVSGWIPLASLEPGMVPRA